MNAPDTNTSEKVLLISGKQEDVLQCLSEALGYLREGREESIDAQLLVQRSQIGSVIGTAGGKIKELREKTEAQMKVFSDCLPSSTERVVCISGLIPTIASCVHELLLILALTPIKGDTSLYDPSTSFDNNFGDPSIGPDLPGGGMSSRGGRGGRGGMRGGMRRGMRGGGSFGGRGDDPSQSNVPDWTGQGDQGFGAGPGIDTNSRTESTQVPIPVDLAEAIIGEDGERLRTIQQRSKANVVIKDAQPGSSDRVITITGTQEAINYAQFLMQQSVRQHAGEH